MKKLISILALALALLTLPACRVNVVLSDIAQQLHEANANNDSGDAPVIDGAAPEEQASAADAYETQAESSQSAGAGEDAPASPTDSADEIDPQELPEQILEDVPAPADLTALSLEELVADADGAAGQLPKILPDCPGGSWINDDIQGTFGYLVDSGYCTLWYDAYKTGRVLSLLIAENYDGDSSYYTPYSLDLATGQRLTGPELLALLGAEQTVLGDTELALMAEEFEVMYGGQSEGESADFYREQYERTVSTDNAEFDRVWLGYGGELYFVARIYSLAGAEFYEYPMATGLYF